MTVPCNECFLLGEDMNHLTFHIVNFSRISELARSEKPQPIIKFYHLSYNNKDSSSILFSQSDIYIYTHIYTLYIYIYLTPQNSNSLRNWDNSFYCSLSLKNNLILFQEQKFFCTKRDSLQKTMILLANIVRKEFVVYDQ